MPLVIPVAIGTGVVLASALGSKKCVDGVGAMKRAKQIVRQADSAHKRMVRQLETARSQLDDRFEKYNEQREEIRQSTFVELIEVLEVLRQRGQLTDLDEILSANVHADELPEFVTELLPISQMAGSVVTGAVAGTAAASVTTAAVGSLATASTGAAISGLSGAAAQSATMAWLGGGALTAGGGGMALGSVVLGGVTLAPAVVVGGFVVAAKGAKALTMAEKHSALASEKSAEIETVIAFLHSVAGRVAEFSRLVKRLDKHTLRAVRKLKKTAEEFDPTCDEHVLVFQRTMLLSKALDGLLKIHILDDDDKLNEEIDSSIQSANSILREA